MQPAAERRLMARFRSRDTKPEIAVRCLLHRLGYRFRIQVGRLPGKPDIILPKYRTSIFAHGCFWHRHAGYKVATVLKTKPNFWQATLCKGLTAKPPHSKRSDDRSSSCGNAGPDTSIALPGRWDPH
uniref:hypothetical protein n=1 Tax=Sphingomonas sp. BE123 TaxID=2817842 RepID=UPI00386E057B